MTNLFHPPTSNFIQKTLGAELLDGVTASATFNNTTSLQNKPGIFIVDRIDQNGIETPTKVEVVSFAGTSGSTVVTLARGLAGTTEQDHAVGAIVEFGPDVMWAQGVVNAVLNFADDNGDLDVTKVLTPSDTQMMFNKMASGPSLSSPTILNPVFSGSGFGTLASLSLINPQTSGTNSGTETLTNKRITKRVGTVTSAAAPTINTDLYDMFTITAQAEAISSMTTNLSGTPTSGQTLVIRFLDNGSPRAITWGASFVSRGATLPTTTVASKYTYVGLIYNSTASKWDCVAAVTEA